MKLLLSLCGLLLLCNDKHFFVSAGIRGNDYLISVPDEYVLKPCDQYPNNFIDKLYDLSNVTYTYNEDDKLVISGSATYIGDIHFDKDTKISADAQVFRKQRGEWVSTIYNIYRPDLCEAIWNPAELWYKLTQKVPQEMRKCPPVKGSAFNIDFEADLTIKNSQDRNAAGDYKAEIIAKYGPSPDDLLCISVLGFIEKI